MRIFITGAGGFLGKHIIRRLLSEGEHAIYATSLFMEDLSEFSDARNVTFVDSAAALDFDFSKADVVVNCAFPRAMGGADFAKGLDFLNALFQRMRPHRNCGLIDISSQSVYCATRPEPADESAQMELTDCYEVGKYCMELLSGAYLAGHRLVHLRLASLIGPRFNQRLVNKFVQSVIAGRDISIHGGGQLFGFLDVRDCAGAICALIRQWDTVTESGEVYNIAPRENYSLLRIAETVVSTGAALGFASTQIQRLEDGEWKNTGIDGSKFYERFRWEPEYSLEDTVADIFRSETR